MRLSRLGVLPTRATVLSAAIFLVALFVRLAPTGLYVTPDEPIWVHRSIQFLRAVETGDWAQVPQTGHPGVTTMALGAAGVKITQLLQPAAAETHLDWIDRMAWLAPENAAAFHHLAFFLSAGRAVVATVTSLGLVLAYHIGRRRLGDRPARWLVLLLALDPFFAGHAGLLHTDALQATFVLLAVLLTLPAAAAHATETGASASPHRARSALHWGGVALCLALAGITKTLGLLAAPGLALAMLIWGEGAWAQRMLRVGCVAVLSAALLFALTPTFFADPGVALAALLEAVTYHESIGLRDVFFAGQTRVDPGPAFYPAVLAYRLTPPVLVGLLAVALRPRGAARLSWRAMATAALPALGYGLALTAATKKFDRYILSAIPPLTIIAAIALADLRRSRRRVLLATLLLPWAAVMIVPLHYATPLLGGPPSAARMVPLGWGEASGLAAGRLDSFLPDPDRASVLTENVSGTAPRFAGRTHAYAEALVGCTDAIIGEAGDTLPGYTAVETVKVGLRRLATLYVVSAERASALAPSLPLVAPGPLPGMPEDAVAPVTTMDGLMAWLEGRFGGGTEFLWLEAPDCHPLTDAQLAALRAEADAGGALDCSPEAPVAGFETSRCRLGSDVAEAPPNLARFAGVLDLIGATWDDEVDRSDPLALGLRWYPQVQLGEVDIYLALQTGEGVHRITWAEGGQRLVNDWTWPAPEWPVGNIADATAYLWIPPHVPPGRYELVMMVSGAGGWLPLTTGDGAFGGIALTLGPVEVPGLSSPTPPLSLSPSPDPGWPGMRVLGIEPPDAELLAGRSTRVALGLQRDAGTPPQALVWSLVCEGKVRQHDVVGWGPSDPASWMPGATYKMVHALRADPELPEGTCQVVVRPASAGTVNGDAESEDSLSLTVGDVAIAQRSRSFHLPETPATALGVDVGTPAGQEHFGRLVGSTVAPAESEPGGWLDVTLYWQALAPSTLDYTVFVHLVGSEGQIWAQSDEKPAGGMAPTVTWAAGEVIADGHRLRLPSDLEPGTYTLYAGLYHAESGARAGLRSAGMQLEDDRVPIGDVTLSP